jgi:hypothetical protein
VKSKRHQNLFDMAVSGSPAVDPQGWVAEPRAVRKMPSIRGCSQGQPGLA